MDKKAQTNFWYVIAAILGIFLFQSFISEYLQGNKPVPIPYSRFEILLNDGKVAEIGITPHFIRGTLREAQSDGLTRNACYGGQRHRSAMVARETGGANLAIGVNNGRQNA